MYIKQHKNLDKKIWTKDEMLNPSVREMLMQFAWAYIDNVRSYQKIDIYNSDVKDFVFFGSLTNYVYKKNSDIDMYISLDIDAIQKRHPNIYLEYLLQMLYKNFSSKYDSKIYGRKIDISIDNATTNLVYGYQHSGPQYSVLHNRWLQKPIKIPSDEFRNINRDANKIYKQLKHNFNIIKKHGYKTEEIQNFLSVIYTYRRNLIDSNTLQPVVPIYIAMRRFKHNGYIDKLTEHIQKNQSAEFILK